MTALKVERALCKQDVAGVGAIRCYCKHRKFEINSSVERGEQPRLRVKRTVRKKTGQPEVEIVFMGEHHDEDHSYYTKDPSKWVTFGGIYLRREKAVELGRALVAAGSPDLLDFKSQTISLGGLRRIITTMTRSNSRPRSHRHRRRS